MRQHRKFSASSNFHKPFRGQSRLLVAAVSACFVSSAIADPAGYTVINGVATSSQVGNVLTITNTPGAILNWNKFGIAAGNTTYFQQTSASSAVLNRVLAGAPISEIYGSLGSNGRVWLINPSGILVGASGRVDTAGFVASSLGVSNSDFLAGRVNLGSADGTTAGFGAVVNRGAITTSSGGSVYLVAPNVSNEGIITTPQGETILAAGQTVQLIDTATPGVRVEVTGAEGNATNLGDIIADAGRIGIAGVIVRNSGTLNASSVVSEGGRVFLKASQDAYVDGAGRIVTTGSKGGNVAVLGNNVTLADGSRIEADAVSVGAGGTVLVLAGDTTEAHGTISAHGGANGGDGGLVETSGAVLNTTGIRVNAGANSGRAGTWLLDPNDIVVSHRVYGGPPASASPGTSTVFDDDINLTLANGTNVTLETASGTGGYGDVVIMPSVVIGSNTNTGLISFTVLADRDITVDGARIGGTNSSGLGINLTAARDILITNSALESNGATMNLISGGNFTLTASAGNGSIVSTAGCSTPSDVACRENPATFTFTSGGLQTINAGGMVKVEANATGGAGVALFSGGGQAITANAVEVRGGLVGNGNDAWITNRSVAPQTISAHSIFLKGGGTNSNDQNDDAGIFSSSGRQTINITGNTGSLTLYGGSAGGLAHNNAALIQSGGAGGQAVNVSGGGSVLLQGGGGTGSYEDWAMILSSSTQAITIDGGGSITLRGGAGNGSNNPTTPADGMSNNFASLSAAGGQIIAYIGNGTGHLDLFGGSVGSSNYARVANTGSGLQSITGNPIIGLTGGDTGGLGGSDDFMSGVFAPARGNTAIIASGKAFDANADFIVDTGNWVQGTQSINAAEINIKATSLTGVANGKSGAGLFSAFDQTVNVLGTLSVMAGDSSDRSRARVWSMGGEQHITANKLQIVGAQSGNVDNNFATVNSLGNQFVTLNADGSQGLALLLQTNNSGATNLLNNSFTGSQTVTFTGNDAQLRVEGPNSALGTNFVGPTAHANQLIQFQHGGSIVVHGVGRAGAGSLGASITSTGTQQIHGATSITISGGNASNGRATISAQDDQSIETNTLSLAGGGGSAYNSSASIQHGGTDDNGNLIVAGNQTIILTGSNAAVTLQGGSGNGINQETDLNGNPISPNASDNFAQIRSRGGNQAVTFAQHGGSLSIYGGSLGNSNTAEITSSYGQTISGSPDVLVQGGSSGGAARINNAINTQNTRERSNGAGIFGGDDDNAGPSLSTMTLNSLTLIGGGNASSYGGAGLEGFNLNLNVLHDVILSGGASNTIDTGDNVPTATSAAHLAVSDSVSGPHLLSLTVGGDLIVTSGTGSGGLAFVGSGGNAAMDIKVAGDIDLRADQIATNQVGIGSLFGTATGSLQVGGTATVTAKYGGTATFGSNLGPVIGIAYPPDVTPPRVLPLRAYGGDILVNEGLHIAAMSSSGAEFVANAQRDFTAMGSSIGGSDSNTNRLSITLNAGRDVFIASSAMETNGDSMSINSGRDFTLTAATGNGAILSTAGCSTPSSVDCRSGPYTAGGQQTVTAIGTAKVEANAYGGFGVALFSGGGQSITANRVEVLGGVSGPNNDAYITNRSSDNQEISAHTIVLKAGGTSNTDENNDAVIYSTAGRQNITVTGSVGNLGSLAIYGGAAGHGNTAGIYSTSGEQNLEVHGSVLVQGGGNATSYQNYAGVETNSDQTINIYDGGSLVLRGGAGGGNVGPTTSSDNFASIKTTSGDQTIDFHGTGGQLDLFGGSVGTSNYARIWNSGAGEQTITGNPVITLTGGDTGGAGGQGDAFFSGSAVPARGNNAIIAAGQAFDNDFDGFVDSDTWVKGSQTIAASGITIKGTSLTGVANGVGGAAIFSAHDQTVNVLDTISLLGGDSSNRSRTRLWSAGGDQTISARRLEILGSTAGASGDNRVSTGSWGDQSITLSADGSGGQFALQIASHAAVVANVANNSEFGEQNVTFTGANARLQVEGSNAFLSTNTVTPNADGTQHIVFQHGGSINVLGEIAMGNSTGNSAAISSSGEQTIEGATSITLTAADAPNARAVISARGDQYIETNSLTLTGGGGMAYDSFASIEHGDNSTNVLLGSGDQRIVLTGENASVTLRGGSGSGISTDIKNPNSSNNSARIKSRLGEQQIVFQVPGGKLALYGGSVGNRNVAEVSSNYDQTISGNPIVVLQGGSSGGAAKIPNQYGGDERNNGAAIFGGDADDTNQSESHLDFASLTINGGTATFGQAGVGGDVVTLNVQGNVMLTGGSSNSFDANDNVPNAAGAAFIAHDDGGSLDMHVGGNLILTGGSGKSGIAVIGSAGPSNVDLYVGGTTSLQGATGEAFIGSISDQTSGGVAQVRLYSVGSIALLGGTDADDGAAVIGAGSRAVNLQISSEHDITLTAGVADAAIGSIVGGPGSYVSVQAGTNGEGASSTGGNLILSRTGTGAAGITDAMGMAQIGVASGDGHVSLAAYYGSTGAGNILINEATGVSRAVLGGTITINAKGLFSIRDTSIASVQNLEGYSGDMTIHADSLSITNTNLGVDSGLHSDGRQSISLGPTTGNLDVVNMANAASVAPVYGVSVEGTSYGGSIAHIYARGEQGITAGGHMLLQAGDAGAGNRSFVGTDSHQDIHVAGAVTMTAGAGGHDNRTVIYATGGQDIGAGSLFITGGGSTGSYNNNSRINNFSYGDQYIQITGSNGNNQLQMQGGNGTGTAGNKPDFCASSAACNNLSGNNLALIRNDGNYQSIYFSSSYGGILTLTGGTLGNENRAQIYASDPSGHQQIGGYAQITLTAGASGGVYIPTLDSYLGNGAEITARGSQDIYAQSLTLTGGGSSGNSAAARALLNSTDQYIQVLADVAITGGSGNLVLQTDGSTAASKNATAAFIGSSGSANQSTSLSVGGNITILGGTGASGTAGIGNRAGSADVDVHANGNVTANANVGRVVIGSSAGDTEYGGNSYVMISSGGDISVSGGNSLSGTVLIGSGNNRITFDGCNDGCHNIGTGPVDVDLIAARNLSITQNSQGGEVLIGTKTLGVVASNVSVLPPDPSSYVQLAAGANNGDGIAASGFGGNLQITGPVIVRTDQYSAASIELYAFESSDNTAGNITLGTGSLIDGDFVHLIAAGDINLGGGIVATDSVEIAAGWDARTDENASRRGGNLAVLAGQLSGIGALGDIVLSATAGTVTTAYGGSVTVDGTLGSSFGGVGIFADRNILVSGTITSDGGQRSIDLRAGDANSSDFGGNVTFGASSQLRANNDGSVNVTALGQTANGNGNINQLGGTIYTYNDTTLLADGNLTVNGQITASGTATLVAGVNGNSSQGGNISLGSLSVIQSGEIALVANKDIGDDVFSVGNITQSSGGQLRTNGYDFLAYASGNVDLLGSVTVGNAASGNALAYVFAGYDNHAESNASQRFTGKHITINSLDANRANVVVESTDALNATISGGNTLAVSIDNSSSGGIVVNHGGQTTTVAVVDGATANSSVVFNQIGSGFVLNASSLFGTRDSLGTVSVITPANLTYSGAGFYGRNVNLTAGGTITQTVPITTPVLYTTSYGGTTLTQDNVVGTYSAYNDGSGDIAFRTVNAGGLTLAGNTSQAVQNLASSGAISITSTGSGALTVGGNLSTRRNISISAAGDLVQNSGTVISNNAVVGDDYDISLSGAAVTLRSVLSGHQVNVNATGALNLLGLGSGGYIDDTYFAYNLPFAFNFYGTSYSQAFITTNGLITFGSGTSSYSDSVGGLASYKAIAPAWNDWVLNAATGRDIRIGFAGGNLNVLWDVGRYSSIAPAAVFEAVLNPTGWIRFNYGTATTLGSDVTIGISNGTAASVMASGLMSSPTYANSSINNLRSTTFIPNNSGGYAEEISATNLPLSTNGPISGSAILGQGTGIAVVAAGDLYLNAGGIINAPSRISAAGLHTVSHGGASFTGSNQFSALVSMVNTNSGDIVAYNTASPLTITSVNNNAGNVVIDNDGGIVINGAMAASGTMSVTAHSPITVTSSGSVTSGGALTLTAVSSSAASTLDLLTIAGSVSSTGGDVSLSGGSGVGVTGTVTSATGNVAIASPFGNIVTAPGSVTAPHGTVTNSPHSNEVPVQTNDTQAPTIPNLDVVAGSVTQDSIALAWPAVTDNVGVTQYKVFRDGVQVGTTGVTPSFIDHDLVPAKAYAYTVQACDLAGNCSASSPPVMVTTLAPPTIPSETQVLVTEDHNTNANTNVVLADSGNRTSTTSDLSGSSTGGTAGSFGGDDKKEDEKEGKSAAKGSAEEKPAAHKSVGSCT